MHTEGLTSSPLKTGNGVPQGSVPGPLQFSIYINHIRHNVPNADFQFFADDSASYCPKLQVDFNAEQVTFRGFKLLLNTKKNKTHDVE